MSESNGDEFNVESSESSENPDDAMMNQMLEKIRSGLKNNPNSELNPEKNRMLQVITILIMIMAAVTGAVSQEITGIQDDAASKEAEAQDMFAGLAGDDDSSTFDLIREWAFVRGLYAKGDPMTQYVKLQEECGELAKALLKRDEPEVVDAIGDIIVVLTNLAHIKGYKIEDCMDSAYKVISARTGKMINGTFVKDE